VRTACNNHNLINIYRFWLPFEKIFLGKSILDFRKFDTYKYIIKQLLSYISILFLRIHIRKKGYWFVYLNSITLYPIINNSQNYFLHVREILDTSNFYYKKITRKMNKCKGVIFIDYSTYFPFIGIKAPSIIMNNPIDMESVKGLDLKMICKNLNIDLNNTVISILGTISEVKGVDFIINCLNQSSNRNIILLVVGDIEDKKNSYSKHCQVIAKINKNIRFIGEMADVTSIYAISDYIIRGEPVFAIGRTIYEGLYSGCKVIVPGDIENCKDKIFNYYQYKEKIIFYEPRNELDLIKKINQLGKVEKNLDDFVSNTQDYQRMHTSFINESIG